MIRGLLLAVLSAGIWTASLAGENGIDRGRDAATSLRLFGDVLRSGLGVRTAEGATRGPVSTFFVPGFGALCVVHDVPLLSDWEAGSLLSEIDGDGEADGRPAERGAAVSELARQAEELASLRLLQVAWLGGPGSDRSAIEALQTELRGLHAWLGDLRKRTPERTHGDDLPGSYASLAAFRQRLDLELQTLRGRQIARVEELLLDYGPTLKGLASGEHVGVVVVPADSPWLPAEEGEASYQVQAAWSDLESLRRNEIARDEARARMRIFAPPVE